MPSALVDFLGAGRSLCRRQPIDAQYAGSLQRARGSIESGSGRDDVVDENHVKRSSLKTSPDPKGSREIRPPSVPIESALRRCRAVTPKDRSVGNAGQKGDRLGDVCGLVEATGQVTPGVQGDRRHEIGAPDLRAETLDQLGGEVPAEISKPG